MDQMSYRPGACLMYPCIACGQMDAEPAWFVWLPSEGRDFYGNSIPVPEANTIHDACITDIINGWLKTGAGHPRPKHWREYGNHRTKRRTG